MLQPRPTSVTVPAMAPPSRSATGHFLDARKRRARRARRARRLAGTIVLLVGVLVTLLLSAFGSSSPGVHAALSPKGSSGVICAGTAADAPELCGPPETLKFAQAGDLDLQLPIAQARVTAIGYHGAGGDVIPLTPYGRQANEGVVTRVAHSLFGGGGSGNISYYRLGGEGSPTGAVDVGAAAGTDVYAPVDGTIVGISDYVVNGSVHGARIEIQSTQDPSLVIVLERVRPDPALTVGSSVEIEKTKVGVVLDFSSVERQALARHTRDAGNHVTMSVRKAATTPIN